MVENMSLTTEELALYIGSKCLAKVYDLEKPQLLFIDCDMLSTTGKNCFSNIQPLLRPVSKMTDEEFREVVLLFWGRNIDTKRITRIVRKDEIKQIPEFGTTIPYSVYGKIDKDGVNEAEHHMMSTAFSSKSLNPEQFQYLLSKQIDLFGWIPKGLAIDITETHF